MSSKKILFALLSIGLGTQAAMATDFVWCGAQNANTAIFYDPAHGFFDCKGYNSNTTCRASGNAGCFSCTQGSSFHVAGKVFNKTGYKKFSINSKGACVAGTGAGPGTKVTKTQLPNTNNGPGTNVASGTKDKTDAGVPGANNTVTPQKTDETKIAEGNLNSPAPQNSSNNVTITTDKNGNQIISVNNNPIDPSKNQVWSQNSDIKSIDGKPVYTRTENGVNQVGYYTKESNGTYTAVTLPKSYFVADGKEGNILTKRPSEGNYSTYASDGSLTHYNATIMKDTSTGKTSTVLVKDSYTDPDGNKFTYNSEGKLTSYTNTDGQTKNFDGDTKIGGSGISSLSAKDKAALAKQERDKKKTDGTGTSYNDPCKNSSVLGKDFRCKATQGAMETAQVASQVMDQAGSMVVQNVGNRAMTNLQMNGNRNFSDTYKAAGDTMKATRTQQVVRSAAQLAAFAVLNKKGKTHNNNADIVGNMSQSELIAVGQRMGYSQEKILTDPNIQENIRIKVAEEQSLWGTKAKQQSLTHLVQGVQSAAQVMALNKNIKANNAYIDRLQDQEKKVGVINGNPYVVDKDNGGNSAITGNDGGNTQVTDNPNGVPGDGGMGPGLGLGGDGGDMNSPKGGNKVLGNGGAIAGGGGSGGGAGGGGGAPVAPPDMNEAKAQPAEITEAKDRFEMGGGNIQAGGGKGKGGGDDKGIDLGNMLAQFLPKDEPTGEHNQNGGILSYEGAANRGIASVEQNSFLDQKTDIFDRLSKKYHGLAEAKRVSAE